MIGTPPLRFLALVVGGWACFRGAMLVPDWSEEEAPPAVTSGKAAPPLAIAEPVPFALPPLRAVTTYPAALGKPGSAAVPPLRPVPAFARAGGLPRPDLPALPALPRSLQNTPAVSQVMPAPFEARPVIPGSRWSASAWAFFRRGDRPQLAAGGALGGSQLGGRISYRLNHDPARALALTARIYAPVERPKASDVAIGLEWKPIATVPVRLLAERRQAIGKEGRSAWALMAYGGVSGAPLAGPLKIDAYGQAGVVGTRSRDLFADGSVAVNVAFAERVRVGAAAWGAAQPGTSRLDLGPKISVMLPGKGDSMRLSAECASGWQAMRRRVRDRR